MGYGLRIGRRGRILERRVGEAALAHAREVGAPAPAGSAIADHSFGATGVPRRGRYPTSHRKSTFL